MAGAACSQPSVLETEVKTQSVDLSAAELCKLGELVRREQMARNLPMEEFTFLVRLNKQLMGAYLRFPLIEREAAMMGTRIPE